MSLSTTSGSKLYRRGVQRPETNESDKDTSGGKYDGKKLLSSTKQYAVFVVLTALFLAVAVRESGSFNLRPADDTRALSLLSNKEQQQDSNDLSSQWFQPVLEAGELSPQIADDEYARLVALPPKLIAELEAF